MLDFWRILAGFLLSALIGAIAYWRGSLTRSGWLGAILTGTATFGFGGWAWGLTLIVFFITSSLLSRFRQLHKQRIAGEKFEKSGKRDIGQALANGGVASIVAILYGVTGAPEVLLVLFAGVMATVTADTWATELGVLSRQPPRLVTTLRVVPSGTSGGVTLAGLLASLAGSLIIGITLLAVFWLETGTFVLSFVWITLFGGCIGSLCDSVLGATVQTMYKTTDGEETERRLSSTGQTNQLIRGWRWMNNDMVNLVSSLVGGLAALLLVSW